MTRIAFLLSLSDQWAGGISYYENLFKAIRSVASKQDVTLIGVLTGKGSHTQVLSLLDEIYEIPPAGFGEKLRIKIVDWMRPRVAMRRFMPELAQSRLLQKVKANVVFTTALPGYRNKTPIVSWVPDFQFKHMPDMFPAELRTWLEGDVRDLGMYSNAVILSSHTAFRDFESFLPGRSDKGRVVQFVSGIDASVYEKDPSWVCDEYGLSERFFYLPNQFWKHKNHVFVLDALEIACLSAPDMQVVATGLLNDHRHLTYPSELLATISRRKLRENFIILGYVPRLHLYALMRQSLAVLQPSLFEGWSTSIEEAKSLGKRVLASDIDVHQEQNPPGGKFFPPDDPSALAKLMLDLWEKKNSGPDVDLEHQAQYQFLSRQKKFGRAFLDVIRGVL